MRRCWRPVEGMLRCLLRCGTIRIIWKEAISKLSARGREIDEANARGQGFTGLKQSIPYQG